MPNADTKTMVGPPLTQTNINILTFLKLFQETVEAGKLENLGRLALYLYTYPKVTFLDDGSRLY